MQLVTPGIKTLRPLRRSSSRHSPSMHFDLFEQASLWNHDDISLPQGNITFEIGAGFVGLVVEHENRLIPAWHPPTDLDAFPSGKRSDASRKGNGLHQGCALPDDVGTRPLDFPGDKYLGLEVFFGNIFWRVCYRNRHVEMVVLVVVL